MVEAVRPEEGLTGSEAAARLARDGYNEIAEAPPRPVRAFVRRLWGPVPWMLETALAIELFLGKTAEASIIAGLLVFNAALGEAQEARAQRALDLLRGRLHVMARVLRDGRWSRLAARELVVGDRVHVRMGDIVPADLTVGEGSVEVDQSALTGESAVVPRSVGETLFSGTTVGRGEASGTVTATGARSFFGRTAELVRTARSVGHLEGLLFSVVRYLVAVDGVLAAAVVVKAVFLHTSFLAIAPFVLILLIASVPVAMPATFTVANALEARALAEEGVLVTGLSAVEEAATMEILCSDKTGTLTQNRQALVGVSGFGGRSEADVLSWAAAACDEATQDPIDLALLKGAAERHLTPPARASHVPFDPATKRSEARVLQGTQSIRVVLGSPEVVRRLAAPPPDLDARVEALAASGARVLAVAVGPEVVLEMWGLVAFADPPREDAAPLVRALNALGIRVLMLTGDTPATARAIGRQVGIGGRIANREAALSDPLAYDGVAGVYPEDKYHLVAAVQRTGRVVGMTGDGVNDAPALKQAEVGIAVASATDVAKASAKLVLTRPGLQDIVTAVTAGRRVYRRMLTWTIAKVTKNLEFVILLTAGFLVTGLFVTTPFLIILLVFTNDFGTIAVGTDRARPSQVPDRWNMREIVGIAGALASVWLALSFSIFWIALTVGHLPIAEIQTLMFVYLVFSSQATVYLARDRGPLWSVRPSRPLLAATVADGVAVTALAVGGILMTPVPAALVGEIFGAVLAVALAADRLKVWVYRTIAAPEKNAETTGVA